MSTSFYYTYYASNKLFANTNRTDLPGPAEVDTMTEWLQSSYGATIGKSTDMLDLLSQLKHNSAFNPYDSIDNYITNLENTPLGNMRNDDLASDGKMDDNDYKMYTQGTEVQGVTYTTVNAAQANHDGYTITATINSKDLFFMKPEDQALYIELVGSNSANVHMGQSLFYYEKNGTTYDLKEIASSKNNSDYAYGIDFDDKGFIAPLTSLSYEVDSFMANAGTVNVDGVNIRFDNGTASKSQLTAVYKKLVAEMEGLKEYTLSNKEILDMKAEIATLNSDGVKGNLEGKIARAQDELKEVFGEQLKKINYGDVAYNALFETGKTGVLNDGDIGTAAAAKSYVVMTNLSTLGCQTRQQFGQTWWNYQGQWTNSDIQVPIVHYKDTTSSAPKDVDEALFGTKASGAYDYVNNPFYQYMVALRSDKDLTFDKAFNEAIPSWNTADSKIVKKDAAGSYSVDPSKYSNVKIGDDKLGPIEVLQNLYGTQELLALYKQYEESQNKANSMTLSLNVALQNSAEFDFRKVLADKVLTLLKGMDPLVTVDLASKINTAVKLERGCSTGPSALSGISSIVPSFDGFYGEQNKLGLPAANATKDTGLLVDPYVVTINGTKYVLGQDGDANGNIDNVSEILGINDSQDNPFTSLIALDLNKDGKVSQEELVRNNIVLKAIDNSGKLSTASFDTSLVSGIDLSKIDATANGNVAGTFAMKLSNGSTVQGQQTFDDQSYFNKLFGTLVDLKPYQKTTTTTAATTAAAATTTKATTSTTTATATTTPVVTDSLVHKNLLKQINSAYSALIIDDTANLEETLDNICWKHSVSLTPAQRVKIIDGIDPLLSAFEVEKKIVSAISMLNIKA